MLHIITGPSYRGWTCFIETFYLHCLFVSADINSIFEGAFLENFYLSWQS